MPAQKALNRNSQIFVRDNQNNKIHRKLLNAYCKPCSLLHHPRRLLLLQKHVSRVARGIPRIRMHSEILRMYMRLECYQSTPLIKSMAQYGRRGVT